MGNTIVNSGAPVDAVADAGAGAGAGDGGGKGGEDAVADAVAGNKRCTPSVVAKRLLEQYTAEMPGCTVKVEGRRVRVLDAEGAVVCELDTPTSPQVLFHVGRSRAEIERMVRFCEKYGYKSYETRDVSEFDGLSLLPLRLFQHEPSWYEDLEFRRSVRESDAFFDLLEAFVAKPCPIDVPPLLGPPRQGGGAKDEDEDEDSASSSGSESASVGSGWSDDDWSESDSSGSGSESESDDEVEGGKRKKDEKEEDKDPAAEEPVRALFARIQATAEAGAPSQEWLRAAQDFSAKLVAHAMDNLFHPAGSYLSPEDFVDKVFRPMKRDITPSTSLDGGGPSRNERKRRRTRRKRHHHRRTTARHH